MSLPPTFLLLSLINLTLFSYSSLVLSSFVNLNPSCDDCDGDDAQRALTTARASPPAMTAREISHWRLCG